MNQTPRIAKAFIAVMGAAWAGCFGYGLMQTNTWHTYEVLAVLAVSVASSRMKINLPGLAGNMSVNLPFLLLAALRLNLVEAMTVACATAAVQTVPTNWARPKFDKLLFNVSTMGFASATAWAILHGAGHAQSPTLLALATVGFFLGQTIPVSTIISLTGGGSLRNVWTNMAQLTFPYFVLSAGVASMMSAGRIGWQIPFVALPVMFGVFRSYQRYFKTEAVVEKPLAMAVGAGR